MPRTSDAQTEVYQTARRAARVGWNVTDARASSEDPIAKMRAIINPIRVQLSPASTYNLCSKAVGELQPEPQASELSSAILVYVGGRATELDSAKRWNAVFTLLDQGGNELVRVQPLTAQKGSTANWTVSCSSKPCTWSGENIYYFKLNLDQSTVSKTNSIKVIFTRGDGVENREYTIQDLLQGSLNSLKK